MTLSAFFLAATLVLRGADSSLNAGLQRLGADLIVVPEGAESKIETALLMGKPTTVWMPDTALQQIKSIPGVQQVSPQVYLKSLYSASCCSVSETFLVVFDPATDFTVTPWLQSNLGKNLEKGEIIGGSSIFIPPDEKQIKLYGYDLTLAGNLEPTGTGLDQTIFMTAETAEAVAAASDKSAESPLEMPPASISAALVKVNPGTDPHRISVQIFLDYPDLFPIESPKLFGSFRQQISGLLSGFASATVIIWLVSALLIGLVFSLAVNERRRQIAVLRALGATRKYIFRSIIAEAVMLGLGGGIAGMALGAGAVYLFQDWITLSLGVPFLFPEPYSFVLLFGSGVVLSVATVSLAAAFPAYRVCRQEAAIAMRE